MADDEARLRVLELARRIYGEDELELELDDDTATVKHGRKVLLMVKAFDGAPLAALERHLRRRVP